MMRPLAVHDLKDTETSEIELTFGGEAGFQIPSDGHGGDFEKARGVADEEWGEHKITSISMRVGEYIGRARKDLLERAGHFKTSS